jgi:hypothetical protein
MNDLILNIRRFLEQWPEKFFMEKYRVKSPAE